jgi:hypothetical protein
MAVKPYLDKYTVTGQHRTTYPSPWFDISSTYYPKNIKTLFKYCKTFYYKNSFLNSVITKLSQYPITDLIYDKSADEKTKDKYKNFFNSKINIMSLLTEIGLDYFTYGNSLLSINFKFKRHLKCGKCEVLSNYERVKDIKLRNFKIEGKCPKCSHKGEMEIQDSFLDGTDSFNIVRWAPENIDIDYDPLTGESKYYYTMPQISRKKINSGDVEYIKTVPKIFLDSLREKKKIILDKKNLFHFKRVTLAEEDMGFGKPAVLPALADIWYMQTLRKGNEAIAAEHIVPFRTISPGQIGGDPFSTVNLGSWKSRVTSEINKWKEDPNHIAIFPLPLDVRNVGGDAKLLLTTNELKFLEETIINSLGVPLEFIKGGTSWSGSSISLRIVENHFLHYRHLLESFINNFLIEKLHKTLNFPRTKISFKRLRMADDSEHKNLMVTLESSGKISHQRLLDEFGIDYTDEIDNIENSTEMSSKISIQKAVMEAEATSKINEISAVSQVRIQSAVEEEQAKIREKKFEEELKKELQENFNTTNTDPHSIISKYAEEILISPMESRDILLGKLSQKMPYFAQMVSQRIKNKMMVDPVVSSEYMPEEMEEEEAPAQGNTSKPKKENQTKTGPQKNGDVK